MIYHLEKLLYQNAHRVGHEADRKYIPPPKPRWKSAGVGRDNAVNMGAAPRPHRLEAVEAARQTSAQTMPLPRRLKCLAVQSLFHKAEKSLVFQRF